MSHLAVYCDKVKPKTAAAIFSTSAYHRLYKWPICHLGEILAIFSTSAYPPSETKSCGWCKASWNFTGKSYGFGGRVVFLFSSYFFYISSSERTSTQNARVRQSCPALLLVVVCSEETGYESKQMRIQVDTKTNQYRF